MVNENITWTFFFLLAFTMYTQFNTLRVYDDSSTRKNQVNRHIEFLKSMENGNVFFWHKPCQCWSVLYSIHTNRQYVYRHIRFSSYSTVCVRIKTKYHRTKKDCDEYYRVIWHDERNVVILWNNMHDKLKIWNLMNHNFFLNFIDYEFFLQF